MKLGPTSLILLLSLAGCSKWAIDTQWKSGKFRLIAIDTPSQMSLIYEDSPISLIGPTIYAVGANQQHIVVKQHPSFDAAGTKFDRSTTHYFVVGRDKRVRGPLTKEEYDALSASISLPPFTKVFEDLR